jgi:hypothetical protein
MASRRKQETDPLNAAVKVAGEVIDTASNVLSETVGVVQKLNEPLLNVEADIVERVSPTAAKLLRPRGSKKSSQSSEDRTKRVTARKASGRGSAQSNQRTTKAGKSAKKAMASSKRRKD